jgi:aspartyl-tRNA(Asn)/glutamyl-tRNA(Gln) amidotransferase subunit B
MANYYEAVVSKVGPDQAKAAANWLMGDVSSQLESRRSRDRCITRCRPHNSHCCCKRIADGTISNKIAKEIFLAMWEAKSTTKPAADDIIEAKGLKQISDSGALEAIIDEVLGRERRSRSKNSGRQGKGVQRADRPGNESDQGQSQSGAIERTAEEEAVQLKLN